MWNSDKFLCVCVRVWRQGGETCYNIYHHPLATSCCAKYCVWLSEVCCLFINLRGTAILTRFLAQCKKKPWKIPKYWSKTRRIWDETPFWTENRAISMIEVLWCTPLVLRPPRLVSFFLKTETAIFQWCIFILIKGRRSVIASLWKLVLQPAWMHRQKSKKRSWNGRGINVFENLFHSKPEIIQFSPHLWPMNRMKKNHSVFHCRISSKVQTYI